MLSLENGQVQAWSDHSAGGFKGSFQGVHTAGDYVSALATDVRNDYLFCGTTVGYIKTWLMTNYLRNQEVGNFSFATTTYLGWFSKLLGIIFMILLLLCKTLNRRGVKIDASTVSELQH